MSRNIKNALGVVAVFAIALTSMALFSTLNDWAYAGRQIAAAATGLVETEQKVGAAADHVDGMVEELQPKLAATAGHLDAAAANLEKASAGVDVAVTEINRPCSGDANAPCGTIATANRALNSVRLAAGQVTDVSLKEQAQLKALNAQETQVASDAHEDLAKLGAAIDSIGAAAGSITALAANKDLAQSFAHSNTALGAVAGMATDTAQAWHNTLHPKWPKRVWRAITGVGLSAAKFFF